MKIKMNIRNKFLIPTVLLIIVGMGTSSSAVSYYRAKTALNAALLDNILQRAESASTTLQTWLKDRKLDINSWGREEVYSKALADSFVGRAARMSSNEKFKRLVAEYGYYEDISLADETGAVVASSAEQIIGKINVKDREYFKASMAGETYISAVAVSRNTGNPVFFITAPVKEKEQVKGVLTGVVSIAIVKMNMNEFDFGKQMIQQGAGVIEYNYDDVYQTVCFRKLDQLGWTIAVSVPEQQILAPIQSLGQINLLMAVLIIAVAAALIFFIASTVVRPVNRVVAGLKDTADRSIGEDSQVATTITADIADVTQASNEISNSSSQVNASSQALSKLAK